MCQVNQANLRTDPGVAFMISKNAVDSICWKARFFVQRRHWAVRLQVPVKRTVVVGSNNNHFRGYTDMANTRFVQYLREQARSRVKFVEAI